MLTETRIAFASLCIGGLFACAQILESVKGATKEQGGAEPVRDIGSRLELFVDDWLIDTAHGTRLQLHRPVPREVILQIDQPWEKIWMEQPEQERQEQIVRGVWNGPTPFGFSTVMQDGDLYRLYYTWDRSGHPSMTGYAESHDGIHWTKPNLGIIEFRGSKDNNLVLVGHTLWAFAPFRDANPNAKPEERYKALAGGPPEIALVSADGLRWKKLVEGPVLTDGAFDCLNVAFWDTQLQKYTAYYRDYYPDGTAALAKRSARFAAGRPDEAEKADGVRLNRDIKRATSDDFVNWTKGEWLDYGGPREHMYTIAITPYPRAPHILVAFPKRFLYNRKKVAEHPYEGLSDGMFMTSRDGRHWDRRFQEAFIQHGPDRENWTERNPLPTWGIMQTGPAEMSVYWVEHYRHPTNHIRRGTLRTDGFVSLRAEFAGGQMTTRPLIFQGQRLLLNYSTSAAGSIRVELLTPAGDPIAGLWGTDAPELFGDSIAEEYRWSSEDQLGKWSGKPVRLQFTLKDADLYSLRFQP